MSAETPQSCVAADAFLVELAFDESAAVPAEAHQHVATCARCTSELEALRRTRAIMGSLPLEVPSAALDDRILAALDDQLDDAPAPAPIKPVRRWWPRVAAGGALALVATLALVLQDNTDVAVQRPSASPARELKNFARAPEAVSKEAAPASARNEPVSAEAPAPAAAPAPAPRLEKSAAPRPAPRAEIANEGFAKGEAPREFERKVAESRAAPMADAAPAVASKAALPPPPPAAPAPVAMRAAPRTVADSFALQESSGAAMMPMMAGGRARGVGESPADFLATGRALLSERRFDLALSTFDRLLARNDLDKATRTQALEGRVEALLGLGRRAEAEAAASALEPSSPVRARSQDRSQPAQTPPP